MVSRPETINSFILSAKIVFEIFMIVKGKILNLMKIEIITGIIQVLIDFIYHHVFKKNFLHLMIQISYNSSFYS